MSDTADWLILNVDDDHAIRYAKTRALQRAGFRVMEASNGTEALEKVEAYRPSLVLCDVKMPDMSGLEVSRIVKDRFPGTLVMQVSASFVTAHDRAVGLDCGADSYLTEPIEPDELIASVRALLRMKEYEIGLRSANARRDFLASLAGRLRVLDAPLAIMEAACETIAQRLHATRAGFYQIEAGNTLVILYCWATGELPAMQGTTSVENANFTQELEAGRPVASAEVQSYFDPPGMTCSVAAIPILRRSRWEATFFVTAKSGRQWSADEISLVQEAAELTWDAVERARAAERLRALNDSLEQRIAERTRDLLNAEEQLRQAQKMEAVGQLTGGIAHDFNNLLTGIIGGIHVIRRRMEQNKLGEIAPIMDEVTNSAQRAASLTHRLLAFSRQQSLDVKSVDLAILVDGLSGLLKRPLGEGIELATEMPDDLWTVQTDPGQLETALLNLAINARDAMNDGGMLTIAAENVPAAGTVGRADLEPGDYVLIKVRDTGTGMTPGVIARAFDPFYTTKPVGQGTGLGLSMIYGFVKQSHGHVEISSEVGQGTEVRLFLPRGGDAANATGKVDAGGDLRAARGETVLIVEDNDAVRLLLMDRLRELGYAPIEAVDGNQAVLLLSGEHRIDLLITDVGLPGLNGREVAEVARAGRPDLKVLFITGYAEAAKTRADFLPPGAALITKPFELDDLAARIRRLLHPGPGPA